MSPVTLAEAHELHQRHRRGHREPCPDSCEEKEHHQHLDGRSIIIGAAKRKHPVRHAAALGRKA